jgi:DNA-binding transcriptional LysR family regulator
MNLSELELFVAVAQAGGISAAAIRLGVPISTVSRRLKALEVEFGSTLFARSTRRFALSDEGRILLAEVQDPLHSLHTAIVRVRERGAAPSGHLRVAAAPTLAAYFLPSVMADYLARYRSVTAEIVTSATTVRLHEAGIDVALRSGNVGLDPSLVIKRLFRSRLQLVASRSYLDVRGAPMTTAALADHDIIVLTEAADWKFDYPGRNFRLSARLRVSSADLAHRLCLKGAGITLLPQFLVEDDLLAGRLQELHLDGQPTPKDVYLAYLPEMRKVPKVQSFVKLMSKAFTIVSRDRGGVGVSKRAD